MPASVVDSIREINPILFFFRSKRRTDASNEKENKKNEDRAGDLLSSFCRFSSTMEGSSHLAGWLFTPVSFPSQQRRPL
jgi:hypothetical protein